MYQRGLRVAIGVWLTGDEEEDAGRKRLVKTIKGGVVDEGHDANHDADETSQEGQNHEGPGGVPVCCGQKDQTFYCLILIIKPTH